MTAAWTKCRCDGLSEVFAEHQQSDQFTLALLPVGRIAFAVGTRSSLARCDGDRIARLGQFMCVGHGWGRQST